MATQFQLELDQVMGRIRSNLIEKNLAYGDSALSPVRIFSQADPIQQLLVRIDDKLSRIVRGHDAGEDTEDDLIGYLILLKIAKARAADHELPRILAGGYVARNTEPPPLDWRRALRTNANADPESQPPAQEPMPAHVPLYDPSHDPGNL